MLRGKPVEPGRTLLFLDDIQECPAIVALRYFYEQAPALGHIERIVRGGRGHSTVYRFD